MNPYHEIYKSPNHWSSRRGYKIVADGVHISGGEFSSNHSWIMNPGAQASCNCLIKRDGMRVCYVPENLPAHAHGKVSRGTWPLQDSLRRPDYLCHLCHGRIKLYSRFDFRIEQSAGSATSGMTMPRGVMLWRPVTPSILPCLEALLHRIKTLRRQVYGEGYKYDVWLEIEQELASLLNDVKSN